MRISLIIFYALFLFCNKTVSQVSPYKEKHRPQFHFSPPAHWMNDPNGMVYYKGEYHLFYQYYPDSTIWGPMHWGHAISKDLVIWENLPIALYPDSLGYIFSGSVVVDENNTTGFQKGTEKPLVAIFTYHDMGGEKAGRNNFQTQGIAYSLDKGRSWKKYANNPVLSNPGIKDFRDPKVSWHAASKKWIMTMAAGNHIRFYQSANLKNWQLTSIFGNMEGSHGGVWECPDLFELPIKNTQKSKWVLLVSIGNGAPNGGSGTQYFIGDFDGKKFSNNNPKEKMLWVDYGCDNYAGVTWSNAPDKRTVFLGWMSNWQYAQIVPTKTWRSAMTIPRELSLQQTLNGIRMAISPVQELQKLRFDSIPIDLLKTTVYPANSNELTVTFYKKNMIGDDVYIELSNANNESIKVGYQKNENQFYIDRQKSGDTHFSKTFSAKHIAPRLINDNKITMQLWIDDSSIELFADDGLINMTDIFFPSQKLSFLKFNNFKKDAFSTKAKLYKLESIWK